MPAVDLGERRNAGKPVLTMVLEARHALEGAAAVLQFGAKKYARANWRKGLKQTEIADSLIRHLMAWVAGEMTDTETGLPHVDHVLVNALFLANIARTHPDLDDRPKLGAGETTIAGYVGNVAESD